LSSLQQQKDSIGPERLFAYAYMLLSFIPWVGKKFISSPSADSFNLSDFVRECSESLGLPEISKKLSKVNSIFQKETDENFPSSIESILSTIEGVAQNNWSFTYQRIPSTAFPTLDTQMKRNKDAEFKFVRDSINFQNEVAENVDPYHFYGIHDLFPCILQFWNEISEALQEDGGDISDVDFWFLTELVLDNLHKFSGDHVVCADQLLSLPIPTAHRTRIIVVSSTNLLLLVLKLSRSFSLLCSTFQKHLSRLCSTLESLPSS
jgi:hypothetical protein